MREKTIAILWTSGWDSTYRMIQLSRMNVAVQPVYITGMGRKSEQNEIDAQTRILELLRNRKETVAELRPVRYVDAATIPVDERITWAYDEIKKSIALGIQYETLAQYAALEPGIEIGSEGGEAGNLRMTEAIIHCGGLKEVDGSYFIDPEHATEVGKLAFGNLSFPIIMIPESQMVRDIKAWGYEDVMEQVWFCHTPINGQPCGVCRACEVKMMNQMEWLLPPNARRRFRVKRFFWKLFNIRIANGICRRLYQRR